MPELRFRQVTDLSAAPPTGRSVVYVSRLGAGIAFAIPMRSAPGADGTRAMNWTGRPGAWGLKKRMVRAARRVEKVGPVGTKDRLRQNLLRAR